MSEHNSSLSAMLFDKVCMLINQSIREGNHPLVGVTAVENMLRKSNMFNEEFIQALINDLSDFYFWHPEHTIAIDTKWHTQGIDLYKSYDPAPFKHKESIQYTYYIYQQDLTLPALTLRLMGKVRTIEEANTMCKCFNEQDEEVKLGRHSYLIMCVNTKGETNEKIDFNSNDTYIDDKL